MIGKIVEPIDKQIRTLNEENVRMGKLRDILSLKFMLGEIDLGNQEGNIMDDLVNVMRDILSELHDINLKLDEIIGFGAYNSLSDVCDKLDGFDSQLENIKGIGLYNSLSDICDKIDSLETTITLGDNY